MKETYTKTEAVVGKVLSGLLAIAGAVAVASFIGVLKPHVATASEKLSSADVAAVQELLNSPGAQQVQLKAGEMKLVDSTTRGDDTVDVVKVDASDNAGDMTLYFLVENGKVVAVTFAQNGTAQS